MSPMRRTCSSIVSVLLACAALVGCSVTPYSDAASYEPVLENPYFASANTRIGVWTPWEFHRASRRGIYFLESYTDLKIPVLYIHGLYGSPRNFRYLISRLDRTRFQPWVYYYASGDSLNDTVSHLRQQMDALCVHYNVRSVMVIAHSMGGLIARDLLLRISDSYCKSVPVFVSLSTPWSGHRGAAIGARFWPTAVTSWRDLATDSAYIESLFQTKSGLSRQLPSGTEHHLFVSLGLHDSHGVEGDDQVVSVASQLREAAQLDSSRIYRVEETHVGILSSPTVADEINRALAVARSDSR